jgi:ABC-type multidrug transport system fused ATPase/permease subunit
LGCYPLKDGQIRLGGTELARLRLKDLRDRIAYVPQDAYLFAGTIYDNIRFGKVDARDEEIVAAAKAAFADEFIREFPAGYETVIGERGARLSGGQRQRIAIARALLKNAPILLLDEATSALDSESEHLVQEALEVLMRGRTTLVIAHRLSAIRSAEQIYVIDHGQVVEQGRHEELLAHKGVYANLVDLQFQARGAA